MDKLLIILSMEPGVQMGSSNDFSMNITNTSGSSDSQTIAVDFC